MNDELDAFVDVDEVGKRRTEMENPVAKMEGVTCTFHRFWYVDGIE